MTMPLTTRRSLARSLAWFSTGHRGARTNIEPSSQMVQDSPQETPSISMPHRDNRRFLTLHAAARSHFLRSDPSSTALKSP
jgi:hypothetical protein